MEKHVSGIGYLATYVALIVLATASLLFSFLHLGRADLVISLVVAGIKAFLVLWIFMHLVEQRFSNRLIVLVSFLLAGILLALTALDVASRHTFPPAPRPGASSLDSYRR